MNTETADLTPEVVRALLRETVTVVQPGEVVFFTCGDPDYTPGQIREIQEVITGWLEYHALGIKVLVLPRGEITVAEPATA